MNNEEKPITKQCPKCKEQIQKDAVLCKHCGSRLDFPSKMIHFGNKLTGCGCALTILVILAILLIGIL